MGDQHDITPVERPLSELFTVAPLPPSLVGNVLLDEEQGVCFVSNLTAQRAEWLSWKRKASMLGFTLRVTTLTVDEYKDRQGSGSTARNTAGDSEMQARVVSLITKAASLNSSDVHLYTTPDAGQVEFRVNGDLEPQAPQERPIAASMMNAVMASMVDQGVSGNKANEMQYARLAAHFVPSGVASVRVSAAPIVGGRWMNFRILSDHQDDITGTLVERLMALGFSAKQAEIMQSISERIQGILVILGTTGHGKSTTLKHYFEAIGEKGGENLVSIEDPVEYPIKNVKQQSVNHDGYASANDAFNAHVRFNLRGDPDRAMIGELRDKETFQLAIRFTRTGHPVATTLHTTRWYGAIDRLADELRSSEISDPHSYLLKSEIFSGFCYQRLTKQVCPCCGLDANEHRSRIPAAIQKGLTALIGSDDFTGIKLINPNGCDAPLCRAGVDGRTILAEVVETTPLLLQVLLEEGVAAGVDYWKNSLGGETIYDHARQKLIAGLIDPVATSVSLGPLDGEIREKAARDRFAREQAS